MRNILEVSPISFPKMKQNIFDFHESDRLYDIIRMDIATMIVVSKSVIKDTATTTGYRWNSKDVAHRSLPSGVDLSLYITGMPKEINVVHQRIKKDDMRIRELLYKARMRTKKIQVLHGTETAVAHSVASTRFR